MTVGERKSEVPGELGVAGRRPSGLVEVEQVESEQERHRQNQLMPYRTAESLRTNTNVELVRVLVFLKSFLHTLQQDQRCLQSTQQTPRGSILLLVGMGKESTSHQE